MDELGWIVVLIGLMGAIGKLVGKGKRRSDSKGQTLRQARLFGEADSSSGQSSEMDTLYNESHLTTRNEERDRPYEGEEYVHYAEETNSSYERETQAAYHREEEKPYRRDPNKKANPFRHLTREQLREGIILAEVLSEKPRAQNPHPAIARYHQRTKG
ncbi:MAG TPA: hypothetical protein VF199_02620 [Bacillales bacterium]